MDIRAKRIEGPVAPCERNCKDRCAECHSSCERYLKYDAERRKWLEERRAKQLGTPRLNDRTIRWIDRKERLKRNYIYV